MTQQVDLDQLRHQVLRDDHSGTSVIVDKNGNIFIVSSNERLSRQIPGGAFTTGCDRQGGKSS